MGTPAGRAGLRGEPRAPRAGQRRGVSFAPPGRERGARGAAAVAVSRPCQRTSLWGRGCARDSGLPGREAAARPLPALFGGSAQPGPAMALRWHSPSSPGRAAVAAGLPRVSQLRGRPVKWRCRSAPPCPVRAGLPGGCAAPTAACPHPAEPSAVPAPRAAFGLGAVLPGCGPAGHSPELCCQRITPLETALPINLRLGEASGTAVCAQQREACCGGYKLWGQAPLLCRRWDEALLCQPLLLSRSSVSVMLIVLGRAGILPKCCYFPAN